jgi:prepilin-type N-terminal cleavage/methylation domain-containing protein
VVISAPISAAPRHHSGERGFSLIEALVALAIAGMMMLASTALYWRQKTITERLVAQRAADLALENAYELVRAGLPIVPDPSPSAPVVTMQLSAGTVPGTTRVDLVATFRVRGHPFRRTLSALLPP